MVKLEDLKEGDLIIIHDWYGHKENGEFFNISIKSDGKGWATHELSFFPLRKNCWKIKYLNIKDIRYIDFLEKKITWKNQFEIC